MGCTFFVSLNMKFCKKCSTNKSFESFYKSSRNKDGYRFVCKTCENEYNRKYDKTYYPKNQENILKKKRSWYSKNKVTVKNRMLKKSYNIELHEYENLSNKQNNCCAICEVHQSNLTKSLAVDHDHKTGKIRGLLCGNCNTALGLLKENVELYQKSIIYIESYK
jgi:hypothetical protein